MPTRAFEMSGSDDLQSVCLPQASNGPTHTLPVPSLNYFPGEDQRTELLNGELLTELRLERSEDSHLDNAEAAAHASTLRGAIFSASCSFLVCIPFSTSVALNCRELCGAVK